MVAGERLTVAWDQFQHGGGSYAYVKTRPPNRPNPTADCVRRGKQPGCVVFAGQKIPLERPRVRTREGQEVELESYGQL
jgi:hypothetical protein